MDAHPWDWRRGGRAGELRFPTWNRNVEHKERKYTKLWAWGSRGSKKSWRCMSASSRRGCVPTCATAHIVGTWKIQQHVHARFNTLWEWLNKNEVATRKFAKAADKCSSVRGGDCGWYCTLGIVGKKDNTTYCAHLCTPCYFMRIA